MKKKRKAARLPPIKGTTPLPTDLSLKGTVDLINRLVKLVDDQKIRIRFGRRYPLDLLSAEMLNKAFALARSVVILIENDQPDEAFGLTRSLYEMAIYLRYITTDRAEMWDRAFKFFQFGVDSKAYWVMMMDLDSRSGEERYEVERYIKEHKIPDDPYIITRPWSGQWGMVEKTARIPHPLDADTSTERERLGEKAISYQDASAHVHCTQPGLDAYCPASGDEIRILKSRRLTGNDVKACLIVQLQLKAIVRYCFYGMNYASKEELDRLVGT